MLNIHELPTNPISAGFACISSVDKLLGIPHKIIFALARLLQLTTSLEQT